MMWSKFQTTFIQIVTVLLIDDFRIYFNGYLELKCILSYLRHMIWCFLKIVRFVCVILDESNDMIVLLSRCIIYNLVKRVVTTLLLFAFKFISFCIIILYHKDCEFEYCSQRGVLDTTLSFSNLLHVWYFLQVVQFHPPIKLTTTINWDIV